MPPPLYASTTLAGKPWSRWSAELLGRWSSWVSSTVRAFGHRWSTTVLVLRRCIETTGIGACTSEGLARRVLAGSLPDGSVCTMSLLGLSGKHRILVVVKLQLENNDGGR